MRINGQIKKKTGFTVVQNTVARDEKLSLKAKGLYMLIASYITMPGIVITKTKLMYICIEGQKAFDSTWKELKDSGYLIQYKLKDDKTKSWYYEYELLDEPILLEESEEDNTSQSDKNPHPQNGGVANGDVANEDMANGGLYIKTNSINTNSINTNTTTTPKVVVSEMEKELVNKTGVSTSAAKKILRHNNNDLENILYWYEESKKSKTINSLVAYLCKCYEYERPIKQTKQDNFNNFEQREFDETLEEKLLSNNKVDEKFDMQERLKELRGAN